MIAALADGDVEPDRLSVSRPVIVDEILKTPFTVR
jgi:hypothetical protein